MRNALIWLAASAMLLSGCGARAPWQAPGSAADARTLTVFAAASLTDAFKEIAGSFELSHPGTAVTFSFAGSQTLRTQIEQGAQPDVLASANIREMNALAGEGYVQASAARAFLSNKLVVILPPDNPGAIHSLQDLARPGLKLVLAGPDVPAGGYARQALALMNAKFGSGFEQGVLANVASNEEDVKQVVAKVQLGEADAGIVYSSDAVAASEVKSIAIPAEMNIVARYPIAPLARSRNPELAAEFINYVLSPEGQAVLEKWGFSPAE